MKNDEAEFCRVCGKPGWQTNKHKDPLLGDYCSVECLDKAISQNTDSKLLKKEKRDYQEQNDADTYPIDISRRNRLVNPTPDINKSIRHIRQISSYDCGIASTAMLAGVSYATVRNHLVRDILMYIDTCSDIKLLEKSDKAVILYYHKLISFETSQPSEVFQGVDRTILSLLFQSLGLEYIATSFVIPGMPCLINYGPEEGKDSGHVMYYTGTKIYDPSLGSISMTKDAPGGRGGGHSHKHPLYHLPMDCVFVYNLNNPLVKKHINLLKTAINNSDTPSYTEKHQRYGYAILKLSEKKDYKHSKLSFPWEYTLNKGYLDDLDDEKFKEYKARIYRPLDDKRMEYNNKKRIILNSIFYKKNFLPLDEIQMKLIEARNFKINKVTINKNKPVEFKWFEIGHVVNNKTSLIERVVIYENYYIGLEKEKRINWNKIRQICGVKK